MSARPLVAFLAALCVVASPAIAATEPASNGPTLAEATRETRAHALFRQIRCVVCQNESIDDSEAPLAGDLRQIVREQILAGRDDAQIRRFLTDRYGDFVLLKPRFSPVNAVLWTAPFLIVLAGLGGFAARGRARMTPAAAPLSAEERIRLSEIAAQESDQPTAKRRADTLPPDTGLTKGFDLS